MSALLAQLKDEGFKPADPNFFNQSITALSASLALQTNLTSAMSGFVTAKRLESYLAHASCPVGDSVKWELLVAPGTESLLFNQPLLEKVVSNIKEDSLISSTASLASLSKAASRGHSGASSSGGSSSPLNFSRPSTSGYGKRSAWPRRGDNKRPCRGRGRTPSSTEGARKIESWGPGITRLRATSIREESQQSPEIPRRTSTRWSSSPGVIPGRVSSGIPGGLRHNSREFPAV